jgi:hypothetical protein
MVSSSPSEAMWASLSAWQSGQRRMGWSGGGSSRRRSQSKQCDENAVVAARSYRRWTCESGDVIELHPVELGYLRGGAQLATMVACTGLYRRGVLVRRRVETVGPALVVDTDRELDGQAVERAVAAAIAGGVPLPDLLARMGAADSMHAVRVRLIDLGLLRDIHGGSTARRLWCRIRGRRTAAGDRVVAAAVAAAPRADATDPADAARRVAALGAPALRSVAPGLARAFGVTWSPKVGRFDAARIVERGIRHKTLRRSRGRVAGESAGYSFEQVKSGYDHGWGGGGDGDGLFG